MIEKNSNNKLVIAWLVAGLVMIYLQIVIGGITRLTGSGLSITEWEIVTGTFPPLGTEGWIEEFEKYKQTPQYEKINRDMEMGSVLTPGTFKFIYFWEYLHRLWARLMGFVFIIPFAFFYFKKWIPKLLLKHLGIVIGLAVLAATFGWIMVASGLINRPWVNAYKLSIHLCIGISVFIALWWAFIRYVYSNYKLRVTGLPTFVKVLLGLLILQILLGGIMSGTKAALFINSWPSYHGSWIPPIILEHGNWNFDNFNNYEQSAFLVSLIQFVHRTVAYIIVLFSVTVLFKRSWWNISIQSTNTFRVFLLLLFAQVIIGIITLVYSVGTIPVLWGVLHQAVAVLTLACFVLNLFYLAYLEHSDQEGLNSA